METQIKVTNNEELIALLNSMVHEVRNKAVIDGLIAGANYVNAQAQSTLNASKKNMGKKGYSYYSTAFKMEKLKNVTQEEVGIKTGVWDKSNGYILRWLEWGTNSRKTFVRKSKQSGKTTQAMDRGAMSGSHYFFGAVRGQSDRVFQVVSAAIIESLQKLMEKGN